MPSGFRKQRAVSALDTAHRFGLERPPSAPICEAFWRAGLPLTGMGLAQPG
jgi:hypothetical protein